MMKILFYLFFMIPMFFYMKNFWYLFQFMILLIMLIFSMFLINPFFSCIGFGFGLDFYSFGLIILSLLIISLMIISSNLISLSYFTVYFLFVNLILCISLLLVFSSMNMFIMYLFFEFSLIPLLMLIFGWGYQPERLLSGLYLFFYTLFASLPLLFMILSFNSFNYSFFFDIYFDININLLTHFFLVFAFIVKLPMFMLHFWLPKAHVQAPVSGSMILAGLLLKIGGYGLIRFMSLHEFSFIMWSYIWYSMGLVGCILVSFICLIQSDVKCLIAYSSIAHMSMCLMGFMTMTKWGIVGSYFMMLAHGLCSSALFCLANVSYERYHSRSFYINKGLVNLMPSMSLSWFMFCAFNMSCPPSLSFFSEVIIINSMMNYWSSSYLYFIFISFLAACFSYYLFSFTQHGMYNNYYSYSLGMVREYLLLIVHLIFLLVFVLSMNFIMY